MIFELTKEEQNAINTLRRLSKRWPKSLWIYCNGLNVHVMRKNDEGAHAMTHSGGIDPEYVVDTVDIENDGGDW